MYSPSEKEILEETARIMTVASYEMLIDTIAELSTALGVSEIRGIPVRTYMAAKQILREDALCAEFADVNPSLAAGVRNQILSSRS